MATKKPTLATHSQPCCGECKFIAPIPDDKTSTGCYVNPPIFAYGDEENPVFLDYSPVKVTRPACKYFQRKGVN